MNGQTLMNKTIFYALIVIVVLALFLNKDDKTNEEVKQDVVTEKTGKDNSYYKTTSKDAIGDDIPITREEVVNSIALSLYATSEIDSVVADEMFTDVDKDSELNKKLFLLRDKNLFGKEGEFRPKEIVSLSECENLVKALNKNTNINLQVTEENKESDVSYALWNNILQSLLSEMSTKGSMYDTFGVTNATFTVLATNENNKEIPKNYIVTEYGIKKISFINYENFVNKSINTLIKDDVIIMANAKVSDKPTINSALVVSNVDDKMTIFTGGVYRTYNIEKPLGDNYTNKLVNFAIHDNVAKDISLTTEEYIQEIKMKDKDKVVFKDKTYNYLKSDEFKKVKIYDLSGDEAKFSSLNNVFVGEDNVKFFIKDNYIVGGVIYKKKDNENIRVALNDSSFNNLYFKEVAFSGNLSYEGKGAKEVTIKADKMKENEVKTIKSNSEITFDTIKRDVGVPSYSGSFDVIKTDKGLVVVNDVSMNEYLKKVVPSEMPSTYSEEALKAQAVTARSFAYTQAKGQTYEKVGADVDDSVLSQVYNNCKTAESSDKAVESTKGEMLKYDDKVITTNFFSTSSGYTANSGDVWANNKSQKFPAETPVYLQEQSMLEGGKKIDFSNEDEVLKFYKNKDLTAVDSDLSWFRWNTTLSYADITSNINTVIPDRIKTAPFMFTINETNFNKFNFGNIKSIEVVDRADSGLLREVCIKSDKYTLNVKGEYNIRKVFSPSKSTIVRKDNSKVENYSILPSAYISIVQNKDSVDIFGGGNGHGVGMSQNGAERMSMNGKSYREILEFFYTDAEVSGL